MRNMFQIAPLLLAGVLLATAYGQTTPEPQSSTARPSSQTLKAPLAFGLEDGTPVKLRISRTISSADAKIGETVDFEVLEDVKVGELLLIPRAGIAWATVTEAQPKRRLARGGKLNINIDNVRLVSGEKAALRAVKETKGGGNTGVMTGAIVAAGILFFPAAPLFLLMQGKDITIPKGTEITAYINGDVTLDPRKFGPRIQNDGQAGQPSSQANIEQTLRPMDPESSGLTIKAVPDGGEIEIDGKFVGSTPSVLRLPIGQHTVSIKKAGYFRWERTIRLHAQGHITLDINLQKLP
jgi:hypothetical protein